MTMEEFSLQNGDAGEASTRKQRENPSELLSKFAAYTTLHGFHFVLGPFTFVRRIFWAILLLFGVGLFILQCIDGYHKLHSRDSVAVKEMQRDKNALFPAVTICNQNMLRRDKIMGTKAQKFLDDIESVMFGERSVHDINVTFSLDLEEVVNEAGHNMSEMLNLCMWQGKECGPEDFYSFVSFQRGLCYTFNSGRPGYPLRYPRSGGRTEGLLLQLDAEPEQYYGPFNFLDGTGFRVVVHDQSDWPDIENKGVDVSPGFSSSICVRRLKNFRLPPPYKSKCGERKLESFKNYSQSACILECWTRTVIDKCRCQLLGMAQLANFNVSHFCGPKELVHCVAQAEGTFVASLDCDCPIECQTVSYDVKLSSSSFPSRHVLPVIMRRLNVSQANLTEELINQVQTELRRRLLQLNIFYQSTITEVTTEKPVYDIYDLTSDVGGNMGLFLGCSLLTIFEFVDLFILLCCGSCGARRKVHAPKKKSRDSHALDHVIGSESEMPNAHVNLANST